MSEELSRVEDLLATGVEEPVLPMSELEAILRGEKIKPHSRVAELLLQYNPQDILIEKSITENGTYYASVDNADGYFKVIVDTPVVPPTVLDHLVETITENGEYTYTPEHDGYSDATITVSVPKPQPVVASKTITENDTYVAADEQLDGYSQVVVNVPPTPLDTMNITHNGTYHPPTGRGFDEVNVTVPLGSKSITANGTYTATDDNLDGYSSVDVDVPQIGIKDIPNTPTPIASFTDGTDNPLKSLTASIVPVQSGSGDPSPTNVRPITGWTEEVVSVRGINQWDEEWSNGYWSMGAYTSGTGICSKGKIPIKPNSTIYVVFPSNATFYYTFYDKDKNFLALEGYDSIGRFYKSLSGTINVPSNAYYLTWNMSSSYGTTYNNDISINYPSTDREYHAYAGTTTTIPFTDGQGQSHTSYGGQIDVISGKEDDTYGIYQKTNFALPTTKDNKNRWEFGVSLPDVLSDLIGSMTGATTDYDLMCNNMTIKLEGSASVGETTCSLYGHNNRVEWRIRISDEYTAEEAQAIANASVIRYPINVVTLQQQPTSIKSFGGENNLWASTGDVVSGQYFGYVYPELGTKTITANGTYVATDDNLDGYSEVTVTIPLGTKTITANGTYTATDDNLDGYSQVTINVAGGGGKFPIYDFHENEDGTIVVRRKVDIVNGKMEIETKWFFNGYHMSAFLTDIPSNLLPFTRPNADVSGKSYSDDTSATQNGWVAISTAYYQNKLVCYSTGWSSDSNKDVWAVIDINGGTQQALEWSDPYEDVGETKYYEYIRALNGQVIVRVEYPDAERTYAKQTLWFFNGYDTDSTDKDIPSVLIPYLPKNWSTDVMMTSGYTDDTSSTQLGWVGFLYPNQTPPSTKIRTWNTGKGGLQSGSFWGVLDISGPEEQITEWFDPYDGVSPSQIKILSNVPIQDNQGNWITYNFDTPLTIGKSYLIMWSSGKSVDTHPFATAFTLVNSSENVSLTAHGVTATLSVSATSLVGTYSNDYDTRLRHINLLEIPSIFSDGLIY